MSVKIVSDIIQCSLCDHTLQQSAYMIRAKDTIYICDECVYLTVEILNEKLGEGKWGGQWLAQDQREAKKAEKQLIPMW